MNYKTLFSVIPADAGIQIQPTKVWIPVFMEPAHGLDTGDDRRRVETLILDIS